MFKPPPAKRVKEKKKDGKEEEESEREMEREGDESCRLLLCYSGRDIYYVAPFWMWFNAKYNGVWLK